MNSPADAIKLFAKDAKKLDPHPSPQVVKRTLSAVTKDIENIRPSASVNEKYALLRRIGRLLKSPAYKGLLSLIIYAHVKEFKSLSTLSSQVRLERDILKFARHVPFTNQTVINHSIKVSYLKSMAIAISQMVTAYSGIQLLGIATKNMIPKPKNRKNRTRS